MYKGVKLFKYIRYSDLQFDSREEFISDIKHQWDYYCETNEYSVSVALLANSLAASAKNDSFMLSTLGELIYNEYYDDISSMPALRVLVQNQSYGDELPFKIKIIFDNSFFGIYDVLSETESGNYPELLREWEELKRKNLVLDRLKTGLGADFCKFSVHIQDDLDGDYLLYDSEVQPQILEWAFDIKSLKEMYKRSQSNTFQLPKAYARIGQSLLNYINIYEDKEQLALRAYIAFKHAYPINPSIEKVVKKLEVIINDNKELSTLWNLLEDSSFDESMNVLSGLSNTNISMAELNINYD